MKILNYLLMLLCVSSCTKSIPNQVGNKEKPDAPYQISDKEKAADAILSKVATKLKNEKGLIPCGTGGRMMGQIKMLALSFDYQKPLDLKTARELLVVAVQKFIYEINADPRVRPYLDEYPFEPKNIQIRIFIQDKNGADFGADKLSVASSIEGVLKYKIDNPETHLFKTIHQETYEEAIELANHSKI